MYFSRPGVLLALGACLVQAAPISFSARQDLAQADPKVADKAQGDVAAKAQGEAAGKGQGEAVGAGKGGGAAALYWMTNEPDGNFVMSASVGADGGLTFGKAVATGGNGAHGVSDPADSPDPLFSQGSVKVAGNMLVAVNAGSNTVSMFAIDEADPASITKVGEAVDSGGEFPMSASIDQASGNVCVLNGGAVNSIMCYKADMTKGLVPLDNACRSLELSNVTTPPSGPANTASQVLFSEDGKQVFASVKGSPDAPGFIAAWDVAEDGSLSEQFTKNTPADGGGLPFSMSLVKGAQGGTSILNTDPALGFSIYKFDGNKATDKGVKIDGQGAACWSDFSPATGNFYITDIMTGMLTEVKVNAEGTDAEVVGQTQVDAAGKDAGTIDLSVVPMGEKDMVYVMTPGTMKINSLALNGPGDVKAGASFDIAAAAKEAGIKVSTPNLQGANAFFKV